MSYNLAPRGEVPERLNGTVSKTVVVLVATVGSNPTLSATKERKARNETVTLPVSLRLQADWKSGFA